VVTVNGIKRGAGSFRRQRTRADIIYVPQPQGAGHRPEKRNRADETRCLAGKGRQADPIRPTKRAGRRRPFPVGQSKSVHAESLFRPGKRNDTVAEFEKLAAADREDLNLRTYLEAT
jgi:hypothetical protein